MEKERLKELRKKQYLNMNLGLIVILLILFGLLYIGINLETIMFYMGILLILSLIFKERVREMEFKLFPYKEELYYYEKERLELEWDKVNRINNFALFILGVMMIFQSLERHSRMSKESLKLMVLLTPLYIAVFNLSLFFHNRKIDKDEESLRGFTRNKLIFSIIVGIIFTALLTGISIFIILK